MTIQYSVAVRNAEIQSIETTIGTAPVMQIFSGTVPATTATAASGTLLASINLPSDWLTNPSAGASNLQGSWTGTATTTGTAGYFRIYDNAVATCHMQGTITISSGGGDLFIDSTSITSGQTLTVTAFTQTAANA